MSLKDEIHAAYPLRARRDEILAKWLAHNTRLTEEYERALEESYEHSDAELAGIDSECVEENGPHRGQRCKHCGWERE